MTTVMQFETGFIPGMAQPGDRIHCTGPIGLMAVATLYRDEQHQPSNGMPGNPHIGAPDKTDEGFWPSKDPEAPGYVPPDRYREEKAKAEKVLRAWKAGEWLYCGVAVQLFRNGAPITGKYAHALWSVECNYPGTDNGYLRDVANELLGGALSAVAEQAK